MIAILLATYNSERYISEQIDSLFQQTFKDWVLYVRDDGSTDNTISIVKEYKTRFPTKVFILDNEGKSLRAYLNFMSLVERVNADYYAFCDHDDVWLNDKLDITYKRMKAIEDNNPEKPILVHTDMRVVDQNLNVINHSFWAYSKLLPEKCSFVELVCCNSVNGCTILFNKKAKVFALQHIEHATMHDMLLAQTVAASGGIVSAVNKPTVLYRQHIDNVVGAHERNFDYYIKKARNIRSVYADNMNWWYLSRQIKNYSLAYYLFVKMKINIYKVVKYKFGFCS